MQSLMPVDKVIRRLSKVVRLILVVVVVPGARTWGNVGVCGVFVVGGVHICCIR